MCLIVFSLLYHSSLLSRSNSMQFTGSIPFLITPGNHRPHPDPYPPPPSQCLSVSDADSIDFRNHFISFSSSHKFSTKDKVPTLYTTLCISHPTPLAASNNPTLFHPLPPSEFFLMYIVVSLLLLFRSVLDGPKILQPEMNPSRKNVGSLHKVVVNRLKRSKMVKLR